MTGEVKKKLSSFGIPVSRNRYGEYKYPSGTVFYTCFTSDLFLEDADIRRDDVWRMIKERSDCEFFIITKRIHRFTECIPDDWGEGYENVTIAITTGNQRMADYRLPIYISLPIKRKQIICEPLLEDIFSFHQTGANFIKDGRKYFIPKSKQREQARKAGIDIALISHNRTRRKTDEAIENIV